MGEGEDGDCFREQTPQDPPPRLQCAQLLQFLQALQYDAPVHVAVFPEQQEAMAVNGCADKKGGVPKSRNARHKKDRPPEICERTVKLR